MRLAWTVVLLEEAGSDEFGVDEVWWERFAWMTRPRPVLKTEAPRLARPQFFLKIECIISWYARSSLLDKRYALWNSEAVLLSEETRWCFRIRNQYKFCIIVTYACLVLLSWQMQTLRQVKSNLHLSVYLCRTFALCGSNTSNTAGRFS